MALATNEMVERGLSNTAHRECHNNTDSYSCNCPYVTGLYYLY